VLSRLEAELWLRLPAQFVGLELSPVAPFAACAAVATVDQNRVLTTTRSTEVVADPTVGLAVEAADRRRNGAEGAVHLGACHRVLRTQQFPPPYQQHFRLFALVSSAPDVGSGRTEATMLLEHLRYYAETLGELFPADGVEITVSAFAHSAAAERLGDTVIPGLDPLPDNVTVAVDPNRTRGRGYYQGIALRIDALHGDERIEIGDGGITDWTARLIPNAKERCLTSCIATERLASLR
jgi:hypothetical protein